jgi:hypothetical protein
MFGYGQKAAFGSNAMFSLEKVDSL